MSGAIDHKLGEIINPLDNPQKDAIHIAIAPVVAGCNGLKPGEHITLDKDGSATREGLLLNQAIGIVDPFLKEEVLIGQTFWVFLYPKTVTNIRHDWTHPAFTNLEK